MPVGINGVQAAAHIFQSGTEVRQRVRFEIDVAELDNTRAHTGVPSAKNPSDQVCPRETYS
jgi:hypothetical protein